MEKNLIAAYNYSVHDWYVLPVKAKEPLWSKPSYDEGVVKAG